MQQNDNEIEEKWINSTNRNPSMDENKKNVILKTSKEKRSKIEMKIGKKEYKMHRF